MADAVRQYKARIQELETAKSKMAAIVRRVAEDAAKLRDWRTVFIPTYTEIGPPAGSRMQTINGTDWPNAMTLGVCLDAYRAAWRDANAAYERLSAAERVGVEPPAP